MTSAPSLTKIKFKEKSGIGSAEILHIKGDLLMPDQSAVNGKQIASAESVVSTVNVFHVKMADNFGIIVNYSGLYNIVFRNGFFRRRFKSNSYVICPLNIRIPSVKTEN